MPEFEDVLYEVGAGRATITINRPDRLNARLVRTRSSRCLNNTAAWTPFPLICLVWTRPR